MRILVIGLGSMGKRRVRCLLRLGRTDITGYDPRPDRRKAASTAYGIKTLASLGEGAVGRFDALVISTPPDRHLQYLKAAVRCRRPAFVEASVILRGLPELEKAASAAGVLIAPSCTLRFHPAVKDIKRIVLSRRYGKVTNFSYHSGQYLPDWHPWEKVSDYYVCKKATGGAREIVPFELTWLADVLGYPEKVLGFRGRTMDVGAAIDDTYALCFQLPGRAYGTLLVDVASRCATRNLVVNLERGQIQWKWDEGALRVYEAKSRRWNRRGYLQGKAAKGYNKNIIEDMYVEEIRRFLAAAQDGRRFPNTLADDIRILRLLAEAEGPAACLRPARRMPRR